MPHPHEQKLHEVVNSLTSESFKSFVAARIAGTSMSPPREPGATADADFQPVPAIERLAEGRCPFSTALPFENGAPKSKDVPQKFPAMVVKRSRGHCMLESPTEYRSRLPRDVAAIFTECQ
jgi:hypothetical protein